MQDLSEALGNLELPADRRHWVALEAAGQRLGLPLNHIRLAIDQGLLQGIQDKDGAWLVFIRAEEAPAVTPSLDPTGSADFAAGQAAQQLSGLSAEEKSRMLERELRIEGREDRLVALLQQSLESREEQLADKDRLLAELSRKFGDLAGDLVRDRGAARQPVAAAAEKDFDPARYERALANIRETLKLVRDFLLEQKRD